MAALTITAANVVPGANARLVEGTAGEAVAIGQSTYQKASDSRWYKADSNASSEAAGSVDRGIAVSTAAAAGQPLKIQVSGTLAFGAILTNGEIYVVGATAAGDINPEGDLTTGWYVTLLGVATSTSNLLLIPGGFASGAVL